MQNRWRVNSRVKQWLIAFLVVIGVYALMVVVLRAIGLDTIHQTIGQMGIWAPLAFVVVCTFSVIVAPISSSSIFVTSGILFGQHIGFLLSVLASTVGCCTNFWISRKLGRKVAARLIGHNSLDDLDRFTNRLNSHHSILFMILVMPISQDVVSYAVGLTKVRFWQFLLALAISGPIVIAAYVYLGGGLLEALI
ncbi:MAG: VTT domain-containing protein [Leptolyngbyaceae cyanobacterium bins.349]|nr:VTT domain-containing protein [Leptolyngbyaceae cyanobacterium bins.349]